MITDGVDDVAAARDVAKAEVLDVAQLLLGSLDKSSVTLPEKGTAAKESEERAARVEATSPSASRRPPKRPRPRQAAKSAQPTETKPVTGLGIAGGAKRPGAKKARPQRRSSRRRRSAAAPQGSRHRRRRQATRRQEGRSGRSRPAAAAEPPSQSPRSRASASPGAKRPGARRRPPPHRRPAPAREGSARDAEGRARGQGPRHRRRRQASRRQEGTGAKAAAQPASPDGSCYRRNGTGADGQAEPEVKGLGIAPGAAGRARRRRCGTSREPAHRNRAGSQRLSPAGA